MANRETRAIRPIPVPSVRGILAPYNRSICFDAVTPPKTTSRKRAYRLERIVFILRNATSVPPYDTVQRMEDMTSWFTNETPRTTTWLTNWNGMMSRLRKETGRLTRGGEEEIAAVANQFATTYSKTLLSHHKAVDIRATDNRVAIETAEHFANALRKSTIGHLVAVNDDRAAIYHQALSPQYDADGPFADFALSHRRSMMTQLDGSEWCCGLRNRVMKSFGGSAPPPCTGVRGVAEVAAYAETTANPRTLWKSSFSDTDWGKFAQFEASYRPCISAHAYWAYLAAPAASFLLEMLTTEMEYNVATISTCTIDDMVPLLQLLGLVWRQRDSRGRCLYESQMPFSANIVVEVFSPTDGMMGGGEIAGTATDMLADAAAEREALGIGSGMAGYVVRLRRNGLYARPMTTGVEWFDTVGESKSRRDEAGWTSLHCFVRFLHKVANGRYSVEDWPFTKD